MREIKFRIWDNLEKAYLNEEDVAIDNRGNVFIFEIYDKNDSDLWYTRLLPDSDNKRYIIEQDTGLKDRNGTKINEGGYVVSYDYMDKKLVCLEKFWNNCGEPVRYETREDAQKSIRENRADWLAYLGIKEWK